MANAQIPDNLKADLPPTLWGKILGATPIAMTVVATVMAGLASSEMNKAQYDRALAAQLQSKASDQWNLFQAKKLRSAMQIDTADMLQAVHAAQGQKPAENGPAAAQREARPKYAAPKFTTKSSVGEMPPAVRDAIQAFAAGKPEADIEKKVAATATDDLAQSLNLANKRTLDFDVEVKALPAVTDSIDQRRFTSARYDQEARLNQDVASVYEMEVRKGNQSAERHHSRSQLFFYGMLITQMAVVISTFALAAKKRNILWSLAAAAGAAAVSFSIYVYLCM